MRHLDIPMRFAKIEIIQKENLIFAHADENLGQPELSYSAAENAHQCSAFKEFRIFL